MRKKKPVTIRAVLLFSLIIVFLLGTATSGHEVFTGSSLYGLKDFLKAFLINYALLALPLVLVVKLGEMLAPVSWAPGALIVLPVAAIVSFSALLFWISSTPLGYGLQRGHPVPAGFIYLTFGNIIQGVLAFLYACFILFRKYSK